MTHHGRQGPCAELTGDISIEFKIQQKYVILLLITYSTDHNKTVLLL